MKAATEMTTAEIRDELKKLNSVLDEHEAARRDPDYEGRGGSPGEGMYERHEELTVELRRRKDKLLVWARQYDIAYFDTQPEDEVARLRAEVEQLRELLAEAGAAIEATSHAVAIEDMDAFAMELDTMYAAHKARLLQTWMHHKWLRRNADLLSRIDAIVEKDGAG